MKAIFQSKRLLFKALTVLGFGRLLMVTGVAEAQTGSSPADTKPIELRRFGHIGGAEFFLSTLSDLTYIEIYDQDGNYVASPAGLTGQANSKRSLSRIPIRLRVTWREQDAGNPIYSGRPGERWSGGKIVATYEIPVADRIPDELLDDLRRDRKGGLRIKVRLHREGVLLVWDIERRPGYDRNKRDQWGEAVYVAPVHSFYGGDFREAEIINGKPVRMGWYIHPKTGERIETAF